jgi:hypothetical protein
MAVANIDMTERTRFFPKVNQSIPVRIDAANNAITVFKEKEIGAILPRPTLDFISKM